MKVFVRVQNLNHVHFAETTLDGLAEEKNKGEKRSKIEWKNSTDATILKD